MPDDRPLIAVKDPTPPRPSSPVFSIDLRIESAHVCEANEVVHLKRRPRVEQFVEPVSSGCEHVEYARQVFVRPAMSMHSTVVEEGATYWSLKAGQLCTERVLFEVC
jgi:hypothetical protein